MKLKLKEIDGVSYAEVQDGKPVYVHDDGKEVAFDAPGTVAKIGQLNGEAKTHREAKEAAEAKLKSFEGIEDPAAAKKALETVKNLDDKKLVDAGEIERVKAEAIKAVEDKYKPLQEERDTLRTQLYDEKIGGSFARSPLINGDKAKFAIPADLVQARFGKHFEVEDGKIVATDSNGNKIYSRSNPGEVAGFDEALEILVDQYPHKEHILRGSGGSGSGSKNGNGGGGGGKTLSRAEFDKLPPAEKAAKMGEGFVVTD